MRSNTFTLLGNELYFWREELVLLLRDSVTRFFASGFFLESVSRKPLIIPLGSFRIFSKIRGDIRSSMFATGVSDTGGK